MSRILDRFRPARAWAKIQHGTRTPPEELTGGVVHLVVSVDAQQTLRINRGVLELLLLTTGFSRTALDGYFEHTSRNLRQTIPICEHVVVGPGEPVVFDVELSLPSMAAPDSRPVRLQWQAKARFAAERHREFGASLILRETPHHGNGAPVVDGTGFLPLYEFRESGGR